MLKLNLLQDTTNNVFSFQIIENMTTLSHHNHPHLDSLCDRVLTCHLPDQILQHDLNAKIFFDAQNALISALTQHGHSSFTWLSTFSGGTSRIHFSHIVQLLGNPCFSFLYSVSKSLVYHMTIFFSRKEKKCWEQETKFKGQM